MAYRLFITVLAVLCMVAGAVALGLCVYFAIKIEMFVQYPYYLGASAILYYAGHMLWLYRTHIAANVAREITRNGQSATGEVMAVESLGYIEDYPEQQWYKVQLSVVPDDGGQQRFMADVVQLFHENALAFLRVGNRVPVKYELDTHRTLLVGEHTFAQIK